MPAGLNQPIKTKRKFVPMNMGVVSKLGADVMLELLKVQNHLRQPDERRPQTSTQAGDRPIFEPPGNPALDNYFFLPGRSGGQIGYGSSQPNGFLKLRSTPSILRGKVYLGPHDVTAYDDTTERLGVGTVSPEARIHAKIPSSISQDGQPNADTAPITGTGFLSTEASWNAGVRDDFSATNASKDSKYNFVPIGAIQRGFRVSLSTVTDPGTINNLVLHYRMWRTANTSGTINVQVNFLAGSVNIWNTIHTAFADTTPGGNGGAGFTHTFTQAEIQAIQAAPGGFGALEVNVILSAAGGAGADEFRFSWVHFRLPGGASSADGAAAPALILENNSGNDYALLIFRNGAGNEILFTAPSSLTDYQLTWPNAQGAASTFLQNNGSGVLSWVGASAIDHGSLGGLTDDDHPQYLLLAGRAGGQVAIGGTASGNNLTLRSTSNATRGKVIFGNAGTTAYDEVNERFGVGTAAPAARLHAQAGSATDIGIILQASASQSANLLECRNSGGGLIGLTVGKQGHIAINGVPSDTKAFAAFLTATVTANTIPVDLQVDLTDNTGSLQHMGASYITTLRGSGDFSIFEQFGLNVEIDFRGSLGTLPFITATRFIAKKNNSGAVGGLTAGFFSGDMQGTGNVSQYWGNYLANPARSGAGTLSGCIGILIENMTAGTTNYAIKSLGGQSYHAGKFGINIDPPVSQLHVVSSAAATKGLIVKAATSASANIFEVQNSSGTDLCHVDSAGRLQTLVNGSTNPIFRDATTNPKSLGIDVSGITANSTRYWAASDVSGVVAVVGDQAPAVSAGRIGKVDATAQAAAIGSTNLTNGAKVGMYVVDWYIETTTADVTAGTIAIQVNYTDDVGATNQAEAAPLALTGTGRDKGTFVVYLASGELSYQTNLTGIIGTSRYALRLRVTYLG